MRWDKWDNWYVKGYVYSKTDQKLKDFIVNYLIKESVIYSEYINIVGATVHNPYKYPPTSSIVYEC